MSSPQEFYYACKGYFDKETSLFAVLRNVALFASHRDGKEFANYWVPYYDEDQSDVPSFVASSIELRNEILEKQRQQNASTGNNS